MLISSKDCGKTRILSKNHIKNANFVKRTHKICKFCRTIVKLSNDLGENANFNENWRNKHKFKLMIMRGKCKFCRMITNQTQILLNDPGKNGSFIKNSQNFIEKSLKYARFLKRSWQNVNFVRKYLFSSKDHEKSFFPKCRGKNANSIKVL